MNRVQELQVETSECREAINALNAKDALTDEETADLEKLNKRYANAEKELREAIKASDAPTHSHGDAETRELAAVRQGIRLGAYLAATVQDRPLEGREAELNAALRLPANTVPIEALETRADAFTTGPAGTPAVDQMDILQRVFADSSAAWLGVRMVQVNPGTPNFPVISAGADAEVVAKGAAVDADAATFESRTAQPHRITARYGWSVEDAATFPNMESALRADLQGAMREGLDARVIGTDLLGATGLTNPADPTSVAGYQDIVDAFVDQVDGRYAMATGQVRMLVGADVYQHFWSQYKHTETTEAGAEVAMRIGGGIRVSAHVPAAASDIAPVIVVRGAMPGNAAICPIWSGIRLIRDEVTLASKGQILVTAIMLQGFVIRRQDAEMKRLEFKLA